MTVQTASYYDIVAELPADAEVTFQGVSWDEYEDLLEQLEQAGESSGRRISFDTGVLTVITLSTAPENYARFLDGLMVIIRLRRRINILSFGSATMRKRKKSAGKEPDACYYVQTADALGNRMQLDFEVDPPPDIAVEIDIHHDSLSKFPIYSALGVPEIWRYDGHELTIHLLQEDDYVIAPQSSALPLLTGRILTEFLTRLRDDGEFQAILAFDEWLQSQPSSSSHP
jgi:Uma2 family endonuclease